MSSYMGQLSKYGHSNSIEDLYMESEQAMANLDNVI